MLKIFFGNTDNKQLSIENMEQLLSDPFVQRVIKEIDKCELTLDKLSETSKSLISLYTNPTEPVHINLNYTPICAKFIEEIASMQDITISLTYIMQLEPSNIKGGIYCLNEERFIKTKMDYMMTAAKHCGFDIGFN